MIKRISTLSALLFLTASCTPGAQQDMILDDAGQPHYTTQYQNDTRGQKDFPMTWDTGGQKLFVFDPKADAWAAYDASGNRVMTGSASGGMDYCPDIQEGCRTVTGTFKVFNKKGEDCKSNEYPIAKDGGAPGGAKMPYCMHFHDGYAIHAAYEVPTHNASHGCIRVLPGAAKWLNENFIDVGTKVLVLPYG